MGVRAVETITASIIVSPLVGSGLPNLVGSDLGLLVLREAHEMKGGIAELDIDEGDSLEVMTDIQFITHAHPAVKLNSLLGDEAGGVTDLGFRARGQSRSVRLAGREAEIQMLGERN